MLFEKWTFFWWISGFVEKVCISNERTDVKLYAHDSKIMTLIVLFEYILQWTWSVSESLFQTSFFLPSVIVFIVDILSDYIKIQFKLYIY